MDQLLKMIGLLAETGLSPEFSGQPVASYISIILGHQPLPNVASTVGL